MEDVLMHYGRKGMKWYQNIYTKAQVSKRKFARDQRLKKVKKRTESRKTDADREVKAERKRAVKKRRTLTDDEIKKRIERLKLEKELKDLTDANVNPGKSWVTKILSNSGEKAATTVVSGTMVYAVKAALEKEFSLKELAKYAAPQPGKKK